MQDPTVVDEAPNAGSSASALRLFRPDSPIVALGLAVNYLMTKPAFARLSFGDWSRILVGQINRKHYYFVMDDKKMQGFVGWALATRGGRLGRRPSRSVLRGQQGGGLPGLQRMGGEQHQGAPLHGR